MSLAVNLQLPSLGFPRITPPENRDWIERSVKYVVELEEGSLPQKIAAYVLMTLGTVIFGFSIIGIPIMIKAFISYGEERTYLKYQRMIDENGLVAILLPKVAEIASTSYERGRELASSAWTALSSLFGNRQSPSEEGQED